jgi:hypothetical protein
MLSIIDPLSPPLAKACSQPLKRTSRVAASWCSTRARALSNRTSVGTPPIRRKVAPIPSNQSCWRSQSEARICIRREYAGLLGEEGAIVLDGSHLADPLFAPLVAGLAPGRPVLRDLTAEGVVLGAALIAAPDLPVGWRAEPVAPLAVPGLAAYRERWRRAARDREGWTR